MRKYQSNNKSNNKQTRKYKAGDRYSVILNEEMAAQLNALRELGFNAGNCVLTSFVFETAEYDKLNKLLGNRTIKKTNVKAKKALLEKEGFKSTNPIVVNIDGKIIDGQHRRQASEELEIPYKFMVDPALTEKNSLETTIELNNSSKPWGINDYVNAFCEIGNENYVKLFELSEELNVNISRTLLLYLGSKPSSQFSNNTMFKGNFIFEEKKAKEAKKIRKELLALEEATMNPTYKTIVRSEGFWKAYLEIRRNPNFKFRIIKEQFEKMRYTLLDNRELPRTIVETYNYKRQEATKIQYNSLNLGGAGLHKKQY